MTPWPCLEQHAGSTPAHASSLPVLLGSVSALAVASAALYMVTDGEIRRDNVKPGELEYVCEGEAAVLCAYTGTSRTWRGRLLQLAKSQGQTVQDVDKSLSTRVAIQRTLMSKVFDQRYLDHMRVVALPNDSVLMLDTYIFFRRPAELREHRLILAKDGECAYPGRMLALQLDNLFTSPLLETLLPAASPFLAMDLRLGVGVEEVQGVPSRDALRVHASAKTQVPPFDDPRELFSGDPERVARLLQEVLFGSGPFGGSARVFVDAEPVTPGTLPGSTSGLAAALKATVGSEDHVVEILTAVLAADGGPTASVQRLQAFAACGAEVFAAQLQQLLRERGGEESLAAVASPQFARRAVVAASGRGGAERVAEALAGGALVAHERAAQKLLSSVKWGAREIAAAQRWLSLYALGRAAFDARCHVGLFIPGDAVEKNPSLQKELQAHRFMRLEEVLPGKEWCKGVWLRTTILGLDAYYPGAAGRHTTELDDLLRTYRERQALQSES